MLNAFQSDEGSISHDKWEEIVEQKTEAMAGLVNQIVPLIATSSFSTIASYFALLRARATPLLISPYLPKEQIQKLLLSYRGLQGFPGHTLLFTSGSGGHPKIVSLSEEAFWLNAESVNQAVDIQAGDRWRLDLPFFHVGGLAIIYRCLLSKATVVLNRAPTTHISLVPTQLYRLIDELKGYKSVLVGGAPISPSLLQKAIEKGIPIAQTYGMTEMASTIALNGLVLPHRELCLSDEDEILVKGKTLFKGYWSKETGLSLPIDAAGWFSTRDLGKWENGQLVILGRRDRLFFSGGENIHPEEIENALMEIPGVTAAIVVPLADPEYGARPVAFVSATLSQKNLSTSLRAQLPGIKIPVAFYSLSSSTLKPQIEELQRQIEKKQAIPLE